MLSGACASATGRVARTSAAAGAVSGRAAGRSRSWWARALGALPQTWRDGVYDWIAANRYRLFGRRQVCRLPTPAERARFVTELDGG